MATDTNNSQEKSAAAIPSIVTYIQEWQEGLRPSPSAAPLP